MKPFILILLILGLVIPAIAQENYRKKVKNYVENLPKRDHKRFEFGFMLGLNTTNFVIKQSFDRSNPDLNNVYIVQSTPQMGFDLGIVSDLRIGKVFDLRFIPTLSFAGRKLNYTLHYKTDTTERLPDIKTIESTFIEFPVFLKFKSWKVRNGRAYILAGGKYTLDLASQKKVVTNDVIVKLEKHDIGFELGFGLDFYLTYFKFSPEIKASFGELNMLVKDNTIFTNSIDKLKTKSIMISFYFQ